MIHCFGQLAKNSSGFAAFLDPEVNKMLKEVLNEWGKYLQVHKYFIPLFCKSIPADFYLQSPNSTHVLTKQDNGWFGDVGLALLEAIGNLPTNSSRKFCEIYDCDPMSDHFGFSSWDGNCRHSSDGAWG